MAKVVITGANRGIGLALAKAYAAHGDEVIATSRTLSDALAGVAGVTQHALDVSSADSVAAFVESLAGPVDILINNAGISGPERAQQTLAEMDYDGWADAFAVNSMGPLRVLQGLRAQLAAAPLGKAVTITSQLGALSLDWPMSYAYCASKAAVNKVMRLAALDLKDEGTAVLLLHPGWVRTDMGGSEATLSVEESAGGIIAAIDGLTLETTGAFLNWDGRPHEW